MKVVINSQHGGFSLSKEGMKRYCEIKNIPCWIEDDTQFKTLGIFTVWLVPPDNRMTMQEDVFYTMTMEDRKEYNETYSRQTLSHYNIARNDSALIQLVEENASVYAGRHATLKVVDIPDDVEWEIEEYDGVEWIAEKHRTWN